MWQDLFAALGLMLVLEGLLPFLSPGSVREALKRLDAMDDRTLRGLGLGSMALGLIALYVLR